MSLSVTHQKRLSCRLLLDRFEDTNFAVRAPKDETHTVRSKSEPGDLGVGDRNCSGRRFSLPADPMELKFVPEASVNYPLLQTIPRFQWKHARVAASQLNLLKSVAVVTDHVHRTLPRIHRRMRTGECASHSFLLLHLLVQSTKFALDKPQCTLHGAFLHP